MDLLAVVHDLSFKPAFVLEKWEVVKVMSIFNIDITILIVITHKLATCVKLDARAYNKD